MLINYQISVFLRTLHDGEHLGWGRRLLEEIGADVAMLPALIPQWQTFEALVHREDLLFSVSKESVETKNISGYDKRRDGMFREMRHRLKFYSRSANPVVAKAASNIMFVMHPYDQTDKRNLFGETTYVRNLLEDLNNPANSSSINLIPGFRGMMDDLDEYNTALDELYTQRLQAMEEVKELGRRLDVRREADRTIIAILEAVNALYLVNELTAKEPGLKATLERIAAFVNGLVQQLEKAIAHRHKRPRKKSAKATEEATSTDSKGSEGSSSPKAPEPAPKNTEPTAVATPVDGHPVAVNIIRRKNASRSGGSSPRNTS